MPQVTQRTVEKNEQRLEESHQPSAVSRASEESHTLRKHQNQRLGNPP